MDFLGIAFIGLYGLFIFVCLILIIYLIIRRIKKKKEEDFGGREN
jgi:preprotein translocase subunit YajC